MEGGGGEDSFPFLVRPEGLAFNHLVARILDPHPQPLEESDNFRSILSSSSLSCLLPSFSHLT